MKIGFFGGSFNPIHLGHINLAIELQEQEKLDEVWFCPANINPHKKIAPIANDLRLKMVELAIEEIPNFKVIGNEIQKLGPSYTVDTLQELHEKHPNNKWYLMLGEDSLYGFFNWKDPHKILKLAFPLVGSRTSDNFMKNKELLPQEQALFEEGWRKISNFDISSTNIRERLSKRHYCGHLLPRKVLDFIIKNGLYS